MGCQAGIRANSKLIILGRGGLPPGPDEMFDSNINTELPSFDLTNIPQDEINFSTDNVVFQYSVTRMSCNVN